MQGLLNTANQAAEIGQAILVARSLRLTEIAAKMRGSSAASYKRIQRFVRQTDLREALWRLFQEQAEFVIGDVTEIERPQAWKTEYVGTLKDGKTKGFWVLLLGTPTPPVPPVNVGTGGWGSFPAAGSPTKTIAAGLDSRNLNHRRAWAALKDLLGECPFVLGREFSDLELWRNLVEEGGHFVIRLSLGSHPPKFWDADGREVALTVSPGESVIHQGVGYTGEVCVNPIGVWNTGFSEPLGGMTNLDSQMGLGIYLARIKSLLGLPRLMNKRQEYMEKMLVLLLPVYAVGVLVGACLRDRLYGERVWGQENVPEKEHIPGCPQRKKGKKWRRYSGLFILLKQKWSVSPQEWQALVGAALAAFMAIVRCPVPTHV